MVSDRKFQALLSHAQRATEDGCNARRKLQEWESRLSREQIHALRRHRAEVWESLAPAVVADDVRRGEVYLVDGRRCMVYTPSGTTGITMLRLDYPIGWFDVSLSDLGAQRRLGEMVPEDEGWRLVEFARSK